MSLSNREQTGGFVHGGTCSLLVCLEGVGGDHEKGSTSVNNAGRAGQKGLAITVRKILIDTPIAASGLSTRDRYEVDFARNPVTAHDQHIERQRDRAK